MIGYSESHRWQPGGHNISKRWGFAENDSERAGHETAGKNPEHQRNGVNKQMYLIHRPDMHNQGIVGWSSFHFENSPDRAGMINARTEPIHGFCREYHQMPGA
jgi:hypothetical protein